MKKTEQTYFLSTSQEKSRNLSWLGSQNFFPRLVLITHFYLWLIVYVYRPILSLHSYKFVLKLRGIKVLTFLVLILTRSGKRHRVTSAACHGYRSPPRSWELFAHDTPSIMWTNGEGRNKGNMSSIKHKIKTKINPCEKHYDFEQFHQTWCCTSRTDSRQRFTRVKFPDDQFDKRKVSITRIPYLLDLTPNPE